MFFEFITDGETTELGKICELALENDADGVIEYIQGLSSSEPEKRAIGLVNCDNYDGPTYEPDDALYGVPVEQIKPCYGVPAEQVAQVWPNQIPFYMVMGMDYAGGTSFQIKYEHGGQILD